MPQEDPKPKAPMKIFVEAARATALAAHSSCSLMMSAAKLHTLRRVRLMEASRIVRQSEALARLAVSLLLAGDFDAPAPAEALAASAATPTRRRRRGVSARERRRAAMRAPKSKCARTHRRGR